MRSLSTKFGQFDKVFLLNEVCCIKYTLQIQLIMIVIVIECLCSRNYPRISHAVIYNQNIYEVPLIILILS